jgi:hypothetical protein
MYARMQEASPGGGVGLYNVNSRLNALLGTGLRFTCENGDSVVSFEIPLREGLDFV